MPERSNSGGRGFAFMTRDERRRIARKGGEARGRQLHEEARGRGRGRYEDNYDEDDRRRPYSRCEEEQDEDYDDDYDEDYDEEEDEDEDEISRSQRLRALRRQLYISPDITATRQYYCCLVLLVSFK